MELAVYTFRSTVPRSILSCMTISKAHQLLSYVTQISLLRSSAGIPASFFAAFTKSEKCRFVAGDMSESMGGPAFFN